MLLSIPMVGIYMPTYDHLHDKLRPELGAYAPAAAGMTARAVAVFATAPLELTRTRQQAASSSVPPVIASGGSPNGGLIRSLLRGNLPLGSSVIGMWTGVGATLARDVPFTAIYWCLVEPIRAHLLHRPSAPYFSNAGSPPLGGAGRLDVSTMDEEDTRQCWRAHNELVDSEAGGPSDPVSGVECNHSPPPSVSSLSSSVPTLPTTSRVFWANMIAGSVSGALAAAATTPFDVVKTRLQTMSMSSMSGRLHHITDTAAALARSKQTAGLDCCNAVFTSILSCGNSSSSVLPRSGMVAPLQRPPTTMVSMIVDIWRSEGIRGLFAGVGPRAARAAPACAIVISTYEVLKMAI